MTDKPAQAWFKSTKKPSKNKSAIRIPISLHFYAVEIVIIILAVFIINIYIQSIFKDYIKDQCNSRLDKAVESTQSLTQTFTLQLDPEDENADAAIREYLYNSIATSDNLSNQASIALYTLDERTGNFTVLWPNAYYSVSYTNTSKKVISKVIEENGYEALNKTQTIDLDGTIVYYRTVGFAPREQAHKDPANTDIQIGENNERSPIDELFSNYYLCVYVNSASYYSFMAANSLALVQAALLASIIAGILSILMTYPLIFSTQKLSRFAKRIAKGDFKPVRGHIVSKELSELGDVMNQMAYKLEESDIEQKTFFQNASHELRTPLMSIQGYAEGLKYGVFESDEERNNAIDVIIDETGRLSGLVENLLSISKMDMSRSGNYEVKKQTINARKICDLIIDKVRGNFIHEDKAIINDIKLKNAYIYGNENDLIRCLENIFSNCLRYCKTAVTFRSYKTENGDKVVFEISDDGPGIAPEVAEHLFERFSKGADGKHGIGLALALAIAEEHGGSVKAYNKEKGGACFVITIPTVQRREQLSKMNNDSTT
ncbi:signal transduction histidine kinase [Ruminococcaceae bacterium R-25]|nr:signal transduction histidine kinase [Ruminococcaceae bacterium R-25]SUQ11201.1 Signal transduction histidine kinase [Oscillospiraceae bacterium]